MTNMLGRLARDESGAIRAWHGSPHDFDKFEWSPRTRGTGEGAQAYGDGLYFAENRDVATGYQTSLAGTRIIDGRGVPINGREFEISDEIEKAALAAGYDRDRAGSVATGWGHHVFRPQDEADPVVQSVINKHGLRSSGGGRLYEVNINAEPEDFLDWDRPLSEQAVHRKYADALIPTLRSDPLMSELFGNDPIPNSYLGLFDSSKGSQAYNTLADVGRGEYGSSNPSAATEALRKAGIPGIRFLDQGSRSGGQGTSNYVVFDDALIDILRKY
jgi:hypothetical protein